MRLCMSQSRLNGSRVLVPGAAVQFLEVSAVRYGMVQPEGDTRYAAAEQGSELSWSWLSCL
jgi:hypothetical protein